MVQGLASNFGFRVGNEGTLRGQGAIQDEEGAWLSCGYEAPTQVVFRLPLRVDLVATGFFDSVGDILVEFQTGEIHSVGEQGHGAVDPRAGSLLSVNG
jgi:hypothetical protein